MTDTIHGQLIGFALWLVGLALAVVVICIAGWRGAR